MVRLAFDALFDHEILPLEDTTSVATRAGTFAWEHVDRAIPDMHFLGVLSVHVTQTSTGPVVLVAKERAVLDARATTRICAAGCAFSTIESVEA